MFGFFGLKRKRLTTRLLMSSLFILILPMILLAVVFFEMTNIIKHNTLEANLKTIRQTQYMIDQSLKEIDDLIIDISSDPSLQWLFEKKTPPSSKEYFLLYDIINRMQSIYEINSDYVMHYYIICPDSGIVLSQGGTYDLSNFYGYIYHVEGMDYDAWFDTYINTFNSKKFIPSADVSINGQRTRAITLLSSIPVQKFNSHQATALILIGENELFSSLGDINTDEGGNIIISDSTGQIIASKHNTDNFDLKLTQVTGYQELSVNGINMLLSCVESSQTGFHCMTLSRSDIALERVIRLERFVIGIYCLALTFSLITSWFMSYINAKPLKEILGMIQKRSGTPQTAVKDEYGYLKSTVSYLIENDTVLKNQMKQHLPIARADFIGTLLRGEITDAEDMYRYINQLDLDLLGKWYNVVLITINGYTKKLTPEALKELYAIKLLLKTEWGNLVADKIKWLIYDKDEQSIVVLTTHTDESKENCQETLDSQLLEIKTEILRKYGLSISLDRGEFCSDLMDIYYVYSSLKDISARKAISENTLSDSAELFDANLWIYYYPVDFEQRLINVVKTGNKEEMAKLFNNIYHENFEANQIPISMQDNLFSEIQGTALKIFKQLNIRDREQIYTINAMLKKIKTCTDSSEKLKETHEMFSYMCDIINISKNDAKSVLVEDVRKFLKENYNNSSIGLSYVASKFHYSDTNFSYFFKDKFGKSFSDYLEEMRIDAACLLISTSALSLEEIAENVGYNSSTSFRRAFKRVKGIIPSQFKKLGADKV